MDTKIFVKWGVALLIGVGIVVIGSDSLLGCSADFFFKLSGVDHRGCCFQSGKGRDLAGAFRRRRQSDGLRPRGAGQRSLEGHDLVRRDVHARARWPWCCARQGRLGKAARSRKGFETRAKTGPGTPGTRRKTPATTPATAPLTPQSNTQPSSQPPAASQPAPAHPKNHSWFEIAFRTGDLTPCMVAFTMGVIAVVANWQTH